MKSLVLCYLKVHIANGMWYIWKLKLELHHNHPF